MTVSWTSGAFGSEMAVCSMGSSKRLVVRAIDGISRWDACVISDLSDAVDLEGSELSSSDSLNLVRFETVTAWGASSATIIAASVASDGSDSFVCVSSTKNPRHLCPVFLSSLAFFSAAALASFCTVSSCLFQPSFGALRFLMSLVHGKSSCGKFPSLYCDLRAYLGKLAEGKVHV